jgi:hypothetical protein
MTRNTSLTLTLLLGVLVLFNPLAVSAQDSADLPEARSLVERYIDAIGGRDAVLAAVNSRSVGSFEMPAMGLTGDLEILVTPAGMKSTVAIPGLGTILSGMHGEIGWAVDPMMGARLMAGEELETVRQQADPKATLRDESLVASMRAVERRTMGGRDCYLVEVSWHSGRKTSDCFDAETGHIVATRLTMASPMGSFDVTMTFSDFVEFEGMTMATRMEQEMMGQVQVITIHSVEYGVVEDAALTPPAEIQALID